jgi:nicotinamidase-related amidase
MAPLQEIGRSIIQGREIDSKNGRSAITDQRIRNINLISYSKNNKKDMKKILLTALTLILITNAMRSQENDIRVNSALLLVDIQNFYFPGDGPGLVNAEEASLKAREALEIFRELSKPVVHVKHLASRGFEIHPNVSPLTGEKVIIKEEVNSFLNTDLLEYLQGMKITRLVIAGMQTHMCLEAAVRAAHDFGFECIVIADACATRDLTYSGHTVKAEDVHASTLATISGGGYGIITTLDSFKSEKETFINNSLK